MRIDSYQMGRLTALFLPAGAVIPGQFKDRKPTIYHRDVEYTDPEMLDNIGKHGWHIRTVELHFQEIVGGRPPR